MPRGGPAVSLGLGRDHGHFAEVDEEAEVLLRERRGIGDGVLRRDRAVGLDAEREAIVVGALADARLGHGEVRAPHRIVDGVDAHHVHRQGPVDRMLFRLDVAPALVHVQLAADLAVVLQREQQLFRVDDGGGAVRLDVPGVYRPGRAPLHVQHRFVHVGGEHEGQLLEALDDLVHVFDHARNGLMLVDHAVEPEGPDGRAAQGGQQQAAQRVAQGIAVAPLQRLQPELGGVGVVLPLGHFHQMGPDQPAQIKSRDHLE